MTFGGRPHYSKPCPGRCGARTNAENLVCPACWDRLPRSLRDELMSWQGIKTQAARLNRLRLRARALTLLRTARAHA